MIILTSNLHISAASLRRRVSQEFVAATRIESCRRRVLGSRGLELLSQSGILSFTVITAMTKNNSAIPPMIMNCGARLSIPYPFSIKPSNNLLA